MAKSKEEKVIEQIEEMLANHWFNPVTFANLIVNNNPTYTQDKLMELMTAVIKKQAQLYDKAWEEGYTSEGLMMASRLAEYISNFEPLE